MLAKLIALVAGFIISTISVLGYGGIVLLMAIESACIPLPSEIIMPFSGYLVLRGDLNLWLVAVAGAVGCVLGSLVAYWVGAVGGRPLVEKYGRYILVSRHDLDIADRWFQRRGDIIILIGRLLPLVRTFIAFPAGVARMSMAKFILYTFIGSFIWCWVLAWIGLRLGAHWDTLGPWFHRFDTVIVVLVVLGFIWYLWRHLRNLRVDS
ncbi:MAG: DedA family protein [Gammaproteobacteria bacterium]|nr:DedA family protein [Gammaproteobacteria bacterium]MDE2461559.1 DedA family protein [Gammaproteobacteria bacterium]